MQECEESAGFLFQHPCRREAEGSCADCDKPVCGRHLKQVEDAKVCVTCARTLLSAGGGELPKRYQNDPYFYGESHFEGYGSYRRGRWGHDHYRRTRADAYDFTEADGESFGYEDDAAWETDMGAS